MSSATNAASSTVGAAHPSRHSVGRDARYHLSRLGRMAVDGRMTDADLKALRMAVSALEHPGFAARLGQLVGKPIELIGRALPEVVSEAATAATTKALNAAFGGRSPHPA